MPPSPRRVKQRVAAPRADFHPVRLRLWHAAALLALLLAVFFREILSGTAWLWEDFIYQYYPTKNFAATAFAAGQIPFWNPYTFSGMPFLADIQNAVLYLPHLVFALFASHRLSPMVVEYMVIAHFFLAGFGTVLLARHLKFDIPAAIAAGAAFMLSGYMIVHTIHETVISSIAWLPVVTLLVLRSFEEGGWKRIPFAGAALAMAIYAGFPQVFYYIFLFVGCLYLYQLTAQLRGGQRSARALGDFAVRAVSIVAIALGLAAMQFLPTMELAPQSARAAISFEKSLEGSLSWGQLWTLLVPKMFGASSAQGYEYWGPGPYWHYWETCFYPGIAVLMLAIVGFAFSKGKPFFRFLAGLAVLSLLIGLGDHFFLHRILFDVLPGYAKFRNPARLTMIFSFSTALLAGLGVQTLMTFRDAERRRVFRAALASSACVLVPLLLLKAGLFDASFPFLRAEQVRAFVSGATSGALLISVLSATILLLTARKTFNPAAGVAALLLLWFIDMHLFGFDQNNGRENPDEYFHRTDRITAPLVEEGKQELFRINMRDGGVMMFDRNQGMMDPLFLMEGYTPLALTNIWPPVTDPNTARDLENVKYYIQVDMKQRTMGLARNDTYLPRAYFAASGRACASRDELERYMQGPAFNAHRDVALEQAPPFALPDSTPARVVPATVRSYTANDIVAAIFAPTDGMLVFSEVYYPGWSAKVDGIDAPIFRANGCYRAVPVRAGTHEVRMTFLPPSFQRGLGITLSTLALCVAWVLVARRRERTLARKDA